jgi:hypothetical protein
MAHYIKLLPFFYRQLKNSKNPHEHSVFGIISCLTKSTKNEGVIMRKPIKEIENVLQNHGY